MRIFDNPRGLGLLVINSRLISQDPAGFAELIETTSLVKVSSVLSDEQIEAGLSIPITPNEQAMLARLAAAKDEGKLVVALKTLTQDQAAAYVQTNVTNLATAKDVMAVMARIIVAYRDAIWPDLPEA